MPKQANEKVENLFYDDKGNIVIDLQNKMADEFYDNFIQKFKPNTKKRLGYRFIKRLFDIFVSLIALILLLPIFVIISIIIKCDSKGPIFFKQKRVGKDGKTFNCYKFRSMRIDAPHDCPTSLLENPKQYQTRIGTFLRKTSLDEIPQLWCVLIGTMSLIGYRPLVEKEENCNNMRKQLSVFTTRPGISGYAQVEGRDDVYYKNKAILDAIYVKNASICFDVKLIFKTIKVVFSKDGNNVEKTEDKKQ